MPGLFCIRPPYHLPSLNPRLRQLTFVAQTKGDLEAFLTAMLPFARYQVATSIRHVK